MTESQRLQILFVPPQYEWEQVNENDEKTHCIKWLHVINRDKTIKDLILQLSNKFDKKLAETYGKLDVLGVQDNNLCDVDEDLVVGDCFDDRDKCRVIVKNTFDQESLKSRYVPPFNTVKSPIASPVHLDPPPPAKVKEVIPKKNTKPLTPSTKKITSGMLEKPESLDSDSDSEDNVILSKRKRKAISSSESEDNNSDLEIIDPNYAEEEESLPREKVIEAFNKFKRTKTDNKSLQNLDLDIDMNDDFTTPIKGRSAAREANMKFNENKNSTVKKKLVKKTPAKTEPISKPKTPAKSVVTIPQSPVIKPPPQNSKPQPTPSKNSVLKPQPTPFNNFNSGNNILNDILLEFKSFQSKLNELKRSNENKEVYYEQPPPNYFNKVALHDFFDKTKLGFDCRLHLVTFVSQPSSPIPTTNTIDNTNEQALVPASNQIESSGTLITSNPTEATSLSDNEISHDHNVSFTNEYKIPNESTFSFLKEHFNIEEPRSLSLAFEENDFTEPLPLINFQEHHSSHALSAAFGKGDSFNDNKKVPDNSSSDKLFVEDDDTLEKSTNSLTNGKTVNISNGEKKPMHFSSSESSDDDEDSADELISKKKTSRLVAQTPSQKASTNKIQPQPTSTTIKEQVRHAPIEAEKENIHTPNKINGLPSLSDLASRGVPDVRDEGEKSIKNGTSKLADVSSGESSEDSSSSSDDDDDEDPKFMNKDQIKAKAKKRKNLFVSMKR